MKISRIYVLRSSGWALEASPSPTPTPLATVHHNFTAAEFLHFMNHVFWFWCLLKLLSLNAIVVVLYILVKAVGKFYFGFYVLSAIAENLLRRRRMFNDR
jgi:hypothetical protein